MKLRTLQLGFAAADAMGAGGGDEKCVMEGLKAIFGEHVTLPVYAAEEVPAR